jgi:shikimate kinase
MSNHYQILFLAGVPATGKSSYGRWLEENHGFIHVDVENSQPEAKDELRSLVWADPNQLIQHLKTGFRRKK